MAQMHDDLFRLGADGRHNPFALRLFRGDIFCELLRRVGGIFGRIVIFEWFATVRATNFPAD